PRSSFLTPHGGNTGVITTAIQLVDTALKAREYVKDFVNAPHEQRQLFSEMDTLRPLLGELQKRVLAHPSQNSFQQMTAPLNKFKTTMEDFTEKLKPADGRWSKFSKQVAWTLWNKKEAKEYLEEFERIKLLLNTWLVLDIWDFGQHQQQDTNQIFQSINDVVQEQQQSQSRMVNLVKDVARQGFDEHDKLIEWLSPLNFFPRQAEILSSRQPGTGEWLLEDDHFKAWKSGLGGTLWCHGIPGAGKTVLASIVVDHLRTEFQARDIGVACIYLNHKETEMQSPSNLLASLWRQLVFSKPISPTISTLYAQHHEERTRPILNEIQSHLASAVAEHSKVYIIVDALDEYPEDRRSILLESLAKIQPTVNLMLTSRPHISISVPTARVLEIRATESDIRSFVEKQIQGSSRLSKHITARPEFKDEIENKLVNNVDGMFLLAKLHMESLTTKNTIRALRDALNNMPKDLEHTYNEAMERIDRQSEDDRNIAHLVLIWISNAKRPLSIAELQEALAIEPGDTTFDSDNILDVDIMLSVCAGLVTVDQTDHITRLVHYTAQQYLDSVQASQFPQAQVDITRTCLAYLSFEMFRNLRRFPLVLVQKHPFLLYAAEYCLLHASGIPELTLESMILAFLKQDFYRFYQFRWGQEAYHRGKGSLTASAPKIWIAAAFNLCTITSNLLLEDASELNQVLGVASKFGALDVVRLLVNAGADKLSPALVDASEAGYDEILRILIDSGADLDEEYYGKSALSAACHEKHVSTARMLIENGADVNWEPHGGASADPESGFSNLPLLRRYPPKVYHVPKSPLCAASATGSETLVLLLIASGASVKNSPALREAAKNGHEIIARILLENGANVDHGALEDAARVGHLGIVKLLIYNALNINMTTALDVASFHGHWDVVRELMENGHLDLREGGGKALMAASYNGEEVIVSLLINRGVNVNVQLNGRNWVQFTSAMGNVNNRFAPAPWLDEYGQGGCSALQVSSFMGQEAIAKLLIKHGANLDIDGDLYGTPLQAAVKAGHEAVVEILLDNGADVNFAGYVSQPALQIAVALGNEKMVRLLLDRGASVQAQDYNDALRASVQPGLEEMVRFLVEKGADVNTQTAARGAKEIAELLIEKGAEINQQGGFYGTALQATAMEGHENIVRLLLENGADMNLRGGPYGSALQAASMGGHENIVRLLETAAGMSTEEN
ncbi:ankyrin repeat-containing domain protein, partial [Mycena rosella]